MVEIKNGKAITYYLPGIILASIVAIVLLVIIWLPIYIYIFTFSIGWLVYKILMKTLGSDHPLGLTGDEIEDSKRISVCIVGAGFSGICMAIKLKKSGIKFRLLEKNPDVGGTWYSNSYPGCRCDVMSVLYQFSFHLNPNWIGWVASREEIQKYLSDVSKYYDITGDTSFNVAVETATWNDEAKVWRVETSTGEVISVTHLVSSCGFVSKPKLPDIPGINSFQGEFFHSAQWNHEYDFTGKRVALVGSGASAVQIGPAIVDKVKSLHVFQRTPNWTLPRIDNDLPTWLKTVFRFVPFSMTVFYYLTLCSAELYALIWMPKGKISTGFQKKVLEKVIVDQLDGRTDLIEKMTPKYEIGCQRMVICSNFLPMFINYSHKAHLVTEPIKAITSNGIVADKNYQFDLIIFATGFDPKTSFCSFKAEGRNGTILSQQLNSDPTAYLGMTVQNFPNFFFLLGPNGVLVHNAETLIIESQVDYITKILKEMIQSEISCVEVKKRSVKRFRELIDKMTQGTNLSGSCRGWYRNNSGVNYIIWPGSIFRYWRMTKTPNLLKDYVLSFK